MEAEPQRSTSRIQDDGFESEAATACAAQEGHGTSWPVQVQALTSQLRLHPNSRVDKDSAEFGVESFFRAFLLSAVRMPCWMSMPKVGPQLPLRPLLRVVVSSLINEA